MTIVTDHPGTLYLGKTGESRTRTLAFREPCIWAGELGKGVAQLLVSPPGGGRAYPVILDQRDGMALWHVTEKDTARNGYGHCELRWSVEGRVLKSRTYTTYVASGVAGDCGCGGDSWGEYLERITRAGAEALAAADRAESAVFHAPTIINGSWWTWDPDEDGYTDTGVPATGEGGGDCGCGVEIAADEDVTEMLDEVFGPRE